MNEHEEYLTVRAQEQTEYESLEYLDDELTAIYITIFPMIRIIQI